MFLIFCRLNIFIRIKITCIHNTFNLLSTLLVVTHQHFDLKEILSSLYLVGTLTYIEISIAAENLRKRQVQNLLKDSFITYCEGNFKSLNDSFIIPLIGFDENQFFSRF